MGYIVADEESANALVIDVPIDGAEPLRRMLQERELTACAIVLTHGHFDHVGEARRLSEDLGVEVWVGTADAPMLEEAQKSMLGLPIVIDSVSPGRLLEEGDVISCGNLRVDVLHVPGHTPGHIALHIPSEGKLFSGDVLFHSSIGRSDLPGGDYDILMRSITEKLLVLPDETVVYPGHGPHTTIGFEKGHNPFVREYLDHF
ncbi:MBL fold metallo-hydrolase [bacterium]|nr:MBL fold metallo-hydrolase [bacterium]